MLCPLRQAAAMTPSAWNGFDLLAKSSSARATRSLFEPGIRSAHNIRSRNVHWDARACKLRFVHFPVIELSSMMIFWIEIDGIAFHRARCDPALP